MLAASRPSRSGPPASLWALHALTLVASSAGPAFMPHVRRTLSLCQELMVRGEARQGGGYGGEMMGGGGTFMPHVWRRPLSPLSSRPCHSPSDAPPLSPLFSLRPLL